MAWSVVLSSASLGARGRYSLGRALAGFALLLGLIRVGWAEPIRVYPENPHYFAYRGTPLVLIASDQHYGAVIDRDFDFVKYLEYLAAQGMNVTRIYPGGMFESPDKWLPGNPLGPLPGRQVLPWERSDQPGANPALAEKGQPSFKFDLDRWNPAYFDRLRAFVRLAQQHDIIVEIAFFNGMYDVCWPLMALYHRNNIQNVGRYEASECGLFTTADQRNRDVIRYQKAYVAKIATELNEFDNVIFDLCDEPNLQGNPDGSVTTLTDEQVTPWLLEMKEAFLAAEAQLPKKHVLGQTVQSLSPDLSAEPWCDWLPTEYVGPASRAFERNYRVGKPLVNVESDYFGYGLSKPYTAVDVRLEGWWFILGGGAGFINLNGEFQRGQETGGTITQSEIIPQKRILKEFIEQFELTRLKRFSESVKAKGEVMVSAVAEPGRQYGVYLFHGGQDSGWGAHFVSRPGRYTDQVTLVGVPAGRYALGWVDPASGSVTAPETVRWEGGDLELTTPEYSVDVALRMVKLPD
ncbi:MAG: DUF4038 domain-containing protein [Acidobacteriota bacterium]|nr:MAG: DUF4038 domain-containing protein [Acidobacteriota bacterium]